MENKIAIFKDAETILEVPVSTEEKTVWLNRQQMSVLFDRDVKTIGKHINNAMREELEGQVVVAKFATTTRHGAMEGKTQTKQTEYYNLDVIISGQCKNLRGKFINCYLCLQIHSLWS